MRAFRIIIIPRPIMHLRRLTAHDAPAYFMLRLRALTEHGEEFTSSPEQERKKPLSWIEQRLNTSASNPDGFVLGAFNQEQQLVGYIGLATEARYKVRHRAKLFGVYVSTEYAGQGLGKQLLQQCLEEARQIPYLEQITLTVTANNERARGLYEAHGFIRFGLERNALKLEGRYLDKAHMVLYLGDAPGE